MPKPTAQQSTRKATSPAARSQRRGFFGSVTVVSSQEQSYSGPSAGSVVKSLISSMMIRSVSIPMYSSRD